MKRICIVFIVLLITSCLIGCKKIKYNAVEFSHYVSLKEKFLNGNRTYGVIYENPNFNFETDEWTKLYLTDRVSPKNRVFVIDNEENLSLIANSFSNINFDEEILIIYMYTSTSVRSVDLKSVNVKNDVLNITYHLPKKIRYANSASPHQEVLILKLDRISFEDVEVKIT